MLQNSDAEKKVIRRIAVFCGSSRGTEWIFEEQAYELGKTLAVSKPSNCLWRGQCGIDGYCCQRSHGKWRQSHRVLPAFLKKVEIANLNLTELVMVDTMHQRKAKMNELSDGVIALPGGFWYT